MENENKNEHEQPPSLTQARLEKMLRVEWLGQMAASIFWIISVLTYGISSPGDWLQMLAACSWFVANLATIIGTEEP